MGLSAGIIWPPMPPPHPRHFLFVRVEVYPDVSTLLPPPPPQQPVWFATGKPGRDTKREQPRREIKPPHPPLALLSHDNGDDSC